MVSALELRTAEGLGRCFHADMEAFGAECDGCTDSVLASELREIGRSLCETMTFSAYTDFVVHRVLPYPLRTAFYMKQPLNNFMISLMAPEFLMASGNVFPFVSTLVKMGVGIDRFAAVLIPTLQRILVDTPHFHDVCEFLDTVGINSNSRGMLISHELFEQMGHRMRRRADVAPIVGLMLRANLCSEISVILPIVRRAGAILAHESSSRVHRIQNEADLRSALDLLSVCAADHRWRPLLIIPTLGIVRHGWILAFGDFLRPMLAGNSVELVLRLHLSGKLQSLIRASHSPHHSEHEEWRDVRTALRRHWPAQVSFVLNLPNDETPCDASLVCPITLEPCIHPVVASDGHTYERDALMHYFAISFMEALSPVTRERLEYHLHPNYNAR